MTFEIFIEYNFAPIMGLIFQLVILCCFKNFTSKEKKIFILTFVLELIEVAVYNIEFYFSELTYPTIWRVIFSVIGYIARPALVYPFVLLLMDDTNSKFSKIKYWDLIPLGIVIIVQQFAFYTDWVFYFNEGNHFVRGPLGYVSQAVTILYLVETGVELVLTKVFNRKVNLALIFVVLAYVVLAMLFESIFDIRSLGTSSGIFSIVFFMFALQSTHLNEARIKLKVLSEIDGLSQLTNRSTGERRINEILKHKEMGVFIILDIDDFKNINDRYGHMVGDETIIKVADTLRNNLAKDDVIMRLGGDEFAVYSSHFENENDIIEAMNILCDKFHEIRLSSDSTAIINVSYGMYIYDGNSNDSFDTLYHTADMRLYAVKEQKKVAIAG